MNPIIKDPHNIRSGQEWFDMLPKQLQERWLFYRSTRQKGQKDTVLREKTTFKEFMFRSFVFANTKEGHFYWVDIAEGRFHIIKIKKSLWSKIINFLKL
jgi:hypothetical protein